MQDDQEHVGMSGTYYAGETQCAVSIAADSRCEMCGALLVDNSTDHKNDHDSLEALRKIADLWLWDSVACEIVLARIIAPDASYRELGKMVGVKWTTVMYHMDKLAREYPQVGYFVRDHGPRAQAQKRRSP